LKAHCSKVEIIRGRFKKSQPRCGKCGERWSCGCFPPKLYRTYEEKLTDVALGVSMVEDAAAGVGDTSVLVSTDTDLHPAIQACQRIAPDRTLYLACPPGRMPPRNRFNPPVTSFPIAEELLADCLLPDCVHITETRQIERPKKWY
jgi:hypothetical protein